MRVLITGGSGFIGKHIVEHLLAYSDYEIIVTGRTDPGFNSKRVSYIPHDLEQKKEHLFEYFKKPDLLIHAAWQNVRKVNDVAHTDQYFILHYQFLTQLIREGLKSLTVIGSGFEYGLNQGCLKEDLAVYPAVPYALAKYTLYQFLKVYIKNLPIHFKWLRVFYVSGQGQSEQTLFGQLDKAIKNQDKVFNMSGGEQVRDYLFVEKLAEYIVKLSLQTKVAGIINCCSGKPQKIKDLVRQYLENKSVSIDLNLGYYPYSAYEPMVAYGDVSKMNEALEAYEKD
ncbi:MAG: NAD-dependent epimerase/dehydratase family protein [Gammaproteobacteria bacterium]|jgi:dTDP-6-deoxy-L-talose 4-dehydrogenase (NAD+)|nr:NAD-dependent epimerase/dehydratase family protein [Gammaproteobacteria bacterium]